MIQIKNYSKTAIENEDVFKDILRDLRDHREERPLGNLVPTDLQTELPINELFEIYSTRKGLVRLGKFTICDFAVPQPDTAKIIFENFAGGLTGGTAQLEYLVRPDNSVEYKGGEIIFKS